MGSSNTTYQEGEEIRTISNCTLPVRIFNYVQRRYGMAYLPSEETPLAGQRQWVERGGMLES